MKLGAIAEDYSREESSSNEDLNCNDDRTNCISSIKNLKINLRNQKGR